MHPIELARQGIAVIPCHPRSKRPRVRWQCYQPPDGRLPTAQELARWFRPGTLGVTPNVAAVCGWRGLAALDFDRPEGYVAWLAWAADRGDTALHVAAESYRVRTARGTHVYVFCDTPAPNGDLTIGGQRVGDVKGYRQCLMLPPSVHPSGAVYAPVDARAPILRVPSLADVIPTLPERPTPSRPAAPPLRHVSSMSSLWPEGPAARIKQRLTLLDLLPEATPSGSGGRWYMTRCPLHDDASPSLRLDLRAGVAACFAGCNGGRVMDVIDLYAALRGVSAGRAIRELSAER